MNLIDRNYASPNDIQDIVIKKTNISIINIFNKGNTIYYHDFIFDWDINNQIWVDTEFPDWNIRIIKNDFQISVYEYKKNNIISYNEFIYNIKNNLKNIVDSNLTKNENSDVHTVQNNKCCFLFFHKN